MSDEKTREVAGVAGAVLFGTAALLEFVRLQSDGRPWPGFTAENDWLFSLLAIVLWIASAFILARRRRPHLVVAVAGAFSLLAFGIVGAISRSRFGIVYVLFALAMPLVMRLAFRGKIELGEPGPEPERPHGPREVI